MKISGELLRDDDTFFFRVYTKGSEEGFIDYDINVHDMSIIINDEFVTFKKGIDGSDFIDYTDEVLGRK